jgi:site-specific DNA-cytosine methylase
MRALELCCGSGLLAAGFRAAGLEFTWAVDASPIACASYERNLGRRPLQIDLRDLLAMVHRGWSPGPLDLLVADPPCAMWSRAGKQKGLADPRDLLREVVELVALLKPARYLIGNVPGLDDAPHVAVVQELLGGLVRHGYCVVDFHSLDAADYGVPQVRPRPYWYGHRAGPCIVWPASTHAEQRPERQMLLLGEPLLPWVTCREALGHLPLRELGRVVRLRQPHARAPVGTSSYSDGNVLVGGAPAARKRARTPQSARVGDADRPATTVEARAPRSGTSGGSILPWPWDRPATTVDCRDVLAPPGRNGRAGEVSAVVLSARAGMILQGFPEGWILAGKTKKDIWAQIDTAVPHAVAVAIGRSIVRALALREDTHA